MGASPTPLFLVEVDEPTLELLVTAATTDAAADEVTPAITADNNWTPARVDWLRRYHRDRRSGLTGPLAEATWAVWSAGSVVGAVRLARVADRRPFAVETGLWLIRGVRGQGLGVAALQAVLARAEDAGVDRVRATTTSSNAAAQAVLRRLGFRLAPGAEDHTVEATLDKLPHA